jgi:glucose/arabinose dehydrogenase
VFVLRNGTGTKLAGSPGFVSGLAWHRGTLYVSGGVITASGPSFQILAWSGWNGTTFTKQRAIFKGSKKFQGFNGLAFGPDGRLYTGASVSGTTDNDHGPRSTSPHLYQVVSMKPNGKDLRVVARGIRQPWQFAFAGRNPNPFVSDLGQDAPQGINPPDFVLRVHPGQDYGFPRCNWIKPRACRGFARPFKFFKPHTDVMGLAIVGNRLYMSEFGGDKPGKVVSMSLRGGKVTTVVSGLSAPFVGLAAHGRNLYIGELTGRVFRIGV